MLLRRAFCFLAITGLLSIRAISAPNHQGVGRGVLLSRPWLVQFEHSV
nr:MAG TPA: hypothetical protein [Caudoviricetes sp.]